MPHEARIFCWPAIAPSALLSVARPGAYAAGPDTDPARRLEAVVRVRAEIPVEALTASFLGTRREGARGVIDNARLIVTIGRLITEAMAAGGDDSAGRASRAEIIGFDIPVLKREFRN
jgi:S1-C subfamily serine protease